MSAYLDTGRTRLWIDPNISLSVNMPCGPGGFCCWSTSVVLFGLASALIAPGNDSVVHNKVVAEIWEHGDIFSFFFLKRKHWFLHRYAQEHLKSCTKGATTGVIPAERRCSLAQGHASTVWRENLKCLCYQ